MALDVRETYLRDCSVHIYFSRVLLDALSVPPLGQVLALGLGHVGLLLVTWALLGALLGILEVLLSAFGFLWRLLVDLGLDFWFIFARFLIFLCYLLEQLLNCNSFCLLFLVNLISACNLIVFLDMPQ